MKIIKDNEEFKSYIVDGVAKFNENILCYFDICIDADIDAMNITAWNIKARNVIANEINVWNITAADISSNSIIANDITALGDITAADIGARKITARKINYWAFCIAYQSLKCSSIAGGRSNSIHKCLDSPIEVIEKKTEIVFFGQKFTLNKLELENLKKQLK